VDVAEEEPALEEEDDDDNVTFHIGDYVEVTLIIILGDPMPLGEREPGDRGGGSPVEY
jgi:hypothetical protein